MKSKCFVLVTFFSLFACIVITNTFDKIMYQLGLFIQKSRSEPITGNMCWREKWSLKFLSELRPICWLVYGS